MSGETVIILLLCSLSLVLFLTQVIPVLVTTLLTLSAFVIFGVMPLDDVLMGFANPATLTIAAMFVLSEGLIRTGSLDPLAGFIGRTSKKSPIRLYLMLGLVVMFGSAFVNNTPIVVMMIPVVLTLARNTGIPPSKLFMPLSFFSILGGTCTLMGTSTNLLIDGLSSKLGGPQLGMFDFLPLGLIFAGVGLVYILLLGGRLLPERDSLSFLLPVKQRKNYVTEVIIPRSSHLVGKEIYQAFPPTGAVRFLDLLRNEEVYLGEHARGMTIEPGDALILEGAPQDLTNLLESQGAELATVVEDENRVAMRTMSLFLVELSLLPDSIYVGRKLKEVGLNKHFGVKVLAIQRHGKHHRVQLRQMTLKPGDLLLVQAQNRGLELLRETGEFLVIEGLEQNVRKVFHAKRALAIMIGVVLLASLSPIPLAVCAMLGAALMILTNCLKPVDAYNSVDMNVIFLLIGTIPIGYALESSGLMHAFVINLMDLFGKENPLLLLAVTFFVTNILTALLSNSSVAVLMTPFALGLAKDLGTSPMPFIMAIAFAASTSLATPIGYQTNLIVMGPGGYSFRDYLIVGLPLNLILWVLAIIFIPIFWPF
ncbi:MAG: SLC13 family permease [Acidobacteria bacterium]|nr:SLC13 family permease [Acidobacteriota bacterium]MCB9399198.1 SLC13 family permease [Acidobacteriota bacterium]